MEGAQPVPDNEIDAGHTRVEEDDAVDDECHGLPEGIKRTVGLNLEGNVPFVGCRPIQTIHRHSNHTYNGHSGALLPTLSATMWSQNHVDTSDRSFLTGFWACKHVGGGAVKGHSAGLLCPPGRLAPA